MRDLIVLIWVAFIFLAAVYFTIASIVLLIQNNKIKFDRGFVYSLSACLISILLCLSIWPGVHRVYDDEYAFMSQSVNIVSFGKPSITLKGSRQEPELFASWWSNPKLPGFALIEAGCLFLTKDFDHSYFILNIILGTLSVAAVYRITFLLTASQMASWWAAIFLACLPARIAYAMSAASDIGGFFFFLLFLLFILEYRGRHLKPILYAAIFCGIYSICIKPFYAVLVFLGLAMALQIYRRDGLLDKKACGQIWLDVFCLFLPILCAAPIFVFADSSAGNYSINFILKNLLTSISYLFNCEECSVLTTIAALAAIAASLFYKRDRLVLGLAGWLLLGIIIFSVFYSGGISYPGHAYSDRYFLFLAFPFVLLAAKWMDDIAVRKYFSCFSVLFLILLIFNALLAADQLNEKAKNNFHYKRILLLKKVMGLVPKDAYILDECAAVVTTISSKRSIQTAIFLSGDHPKRVVYLEGVPGDLYNPEDSKRVGLYQHILDTEYHCQPLTAFPLKESNLSATPFLCARNN